MADREDQHFHHRNQHSNNSPPAACDALEERVDDGTRPGDSTNSEDGVLYLEEVLTYLSQGKLWHFLIFLTIAAFDLPFAFNLMSVAFFGGLPDYTCLGNDQYYLRTNDSNEYEVLTSDDSPLGGHRLVGFSDDKCWFTLTDNATYECTRFLFDSQPYGTTTITEFDLVCRKEFYNPLSDSFFYMGVLLGSAFTNSMSDLFGRRIVILLGLTTQIVAGIAMYFLPGFLMYNICRFIQGLVAKAVGYVSFVLCLEFLPIPIRTFYGVFYNLIWVSGYAFVGLIYYLTQDWRYFSLCMSLPLLLFVGHYWILPESPQFLLACNKPELATKILRQGARVNRLPLPESFELKASSDIQATDVVGTRVYTPLDLLKTPYTRRYFLIVSFLWLANNLAYYMLAMASTRWGSNVYFVFVLGGLIELPAYFLSYLLAENFGRKWNLVLWHMILAILSVCLGFLVAEYETDHSNQTMMWLEISFGIASKFCVGVTFSMLLLVGTEVFPTVLRGQAVGICTLVGDIGTVISPLVFFLEKIYSPLPYIVVGLISLLAGLGMLFVPETWHRLLPVTIGDTEVLHQQTAVPASELRDQQNMFKDISLFKPDVIGRQNGEAADTKVHKSKEGPSDRTANGIVEVPRPTFGGGRENNENSESSI